MDFGDRKVISAVLILAVVFIATGAFLLFQYLSKPSYEAELFSLMPSEGLEGVAYLELTKEGASELALAFGLKGWNAQDFEGSSIAIGDYSGGTKVMAAFIKTNLEPKKAAETFGEFFGGVDTESLSVGGRDLTLVYGKTDSEKKSPVCLWKRGDGIGVLATESDSQSTLCRFASDFSCRGQLFESGMLKIKLKSEKDVFVVTDAACGGTSLSSKNTRYVKIEDVFIGPDKEIWLNEIPCYDAGNTLAKGSSFSGKVFLKYYLESEGPAYPRLAAGDVAATSGSIKLSGARCADILETNYDHSAAVSMLSDAGRPEALLPRQGDKLGTAKFANPLGKAIIAAFGRQEATYVLMSGSGPLVASLSGIRDAGNLKCVTGAQGPGDIIETDGKRACRRNVEGLFNGFGYERFNESNSGFMVIAAQKYPSDRVERTVAELSFGAPLEGSDVSWFNETNGQIFVYFANRTRVGTGLSSIPLEEAQVELYAILPGTTNSMGGLLETKFTDSSGKAELVHVPISGGIIIVSKRGYASFDGRSKLIQAQLAEDSNFSASLQLGPELSEGEVLTDYLADSEQTTVASDAIDARGSFPSLSAFGITLVNSSGGVQSLLVVGTKAPPEEVVLASKIAATFASREYECSGRIPAGTYRVDPYKSPTQLLVLDTSRPEGQLIAVGMPETNAVLREAIGLEQNEGSQFIKEKGNVIAVVGAGKDAMKSAKDFVYRIKRTVPGCGGNSYYGTTKLVDATGRPAVKVVIGAQASTEEALAGAYIATTISSMCAMCVRVDKEEAGCVSTSKANPEQLVLSEGTATSGYPIISIGGPTLNLITNRNCSACSSLYSGQALIRAIPNDIYISGYRMKDTLSAGEDFASALENPMPSSQKIPYYAIKVSGFIQKDSGHHEIILSFYDSVREIQSGKAASGEFYMMQSGGVAKVAAVYARNIGSASVTFDLGGKLIPVSMGRFLCQNGNVEEQLKYCTTERENTTLSVEARPNPAVFMGKLEVLAEYLNSTGDVLDANCSYCILGQTSLCRSLEYKNTREHWYADEFLLKDLPIGPYVLEANCTAEGHKNGTGRVGFNITRVQLPDLIVEDLWVNSVVNTKLTATARIKNIGSIPFSASDATPLVVCLWDGHGRNLFSYINYTTTLKPGESFVFSKSLILPAVEMNNTLVARVDCNNIQPEEKEDNNERAINFGRYG